MTGPTVPVWPNSAGERALDVDALTVRLPAPSGEATILTEVSLQIGRGRILGVAGESGCGKSTLALAVSGLLGGQRPRLTGSIVVDGAELVGRRERELRRIRGRKVGFIPQDPMAALNPTLTVGKQLMEAPIEHLRLDRRSAHALALELLEMVQLPPTDALLDSYAHHLSGGMRQRVMIAIAMSCRPALIVADEPTTALDVTVQAEVLSLFGSLCRASGTALLLVSHDLSVLSGVADEIAVLYAGEVVEWAAAPSVVATPCHPYTHALLSAVPDLDDPQCRWRRLLAIPGKPPEVGRRPEGCRFAPRCPHAGLDECRATHPALREVRPGHLARTLHPLSGPRAVDAGPLSTPLAADREPGGVVVAQAAGPGTARPLRARSGAILHISGLTKSYRRGRYESFRAVDGVDLELEEGQTYGLVGESGSGKSTLAHCVLQLARPYEGSIDFEGVPIDKLAGRELRSLRRRVQVIFQDARNSVDPRMRVGAAIAEPLWIHEGRKATRVAARVRASLDAVGLSPGIAERYPRQCSGGELQRVCIARALMLAPRLLICDEAVTSLDVSNRAQILNLLRDLQVSEGLAMLFISHDFATIRAISDVIGVMRSGRLVEHGPAEQVFGNPVDEYTCDLLSAVPRLEAVGGRQTGAAGAR